MASTNDERGRLQLERPIAFIDADSTGLDPRSARIVRLTVLKVAPDGEEQLRSALINPGMPISPGATEAHGITDDDVADAPSFAAYARSLAEHLEGCDLGGYGIERFDLPLLQAEFQRAGMQFSIEGRTVVDAMAVFYKLEPRDLSAAYRRFVGEELPDQREADTGARAAYEVLLGELQTAQEVPQDPAGIVGWLKGPEEEAIDPDAKFVWSADGEALINFGRYRGSRVSDVALQDRSYLEWIASNGEFSEETRQVAGSALEGGLERRDETE